VIANIFFGSSEEFREKLQTRRSPYNQKVVSKYALCSIEDTHLALSIAKKASLHSKNSKLSHRILWLEDVINNLKIQKDDIAKTIVDEVGKPITFAKIEVDRCIETIRLSISAMTELNGQTYHTDSQQSGKKTISYWTREPVGVVVCITPFNFPLNLIAHKIAPALVSGNTVVLKPTPEAPLTAYKFIKLFVQSPYAIKDAISLIYGDVEVGSTLVASSIPRVLSFTGSVPVGKIIAKTAGIKKLCLELGGNAATYIDSSACINNAAKRAVFGAFVNSGQVCISLQRIYVHESIYDKFANKLKEETLKLKVGNPYDESTFLGPLINQDSIDRAKSWCDDATSQGAKILTGGRYDGLHFYPTIILNVHDGMSIVCEEVFAPIVSLIKVSDFDEAISKINNSTYGLQHSIFTNNLEQSKRFIDEASCGGVVINDIPTLRFDIQPYGGIGESGIGKEGPKYTIEEMTQIKSVTIC
jgi:acyl-CoA reductase-like NAD-dependent aldehyde dehydrogenase